ncbi:MAG: galactoside O-acetyltransferase [Clostridiales Family XIII bacterium]|nr:galactoside O-acetyltransferase [Clostridiales Family XIII bacterium]
MSGTESKSGYEDKAKTINAFKRLDTFLYDTLYSMHDHMPLRFAKLIAMYYPDARMRKRYADYIGVSMGAGTFCNLGLTVTKNENEICVHMGKNVSVAPNVTFICLSTPNNSKVLAEIDYVKNHLIKSSDITVGDDVWIGANVTIFPGVAIGACSVIGAGSMVMQDVEPYSIYAGTPAKKIRDL